MAATTTNGSSAKPVFLVFGKNGWIGGILLDMLQAQGHDAHGADCRMEEREKVLAELEKYKPTHVLNCAGVVRLSLSRARARPRPETGTNSADWRAPVRPNELPFLIARTEIENPPSSAARHGTAPQTGRPNVDWCEDNKEATIRSNVVGTLNLADCCFLKGVHMTNFATGGCGSAPAHLETSGTSGSGADL